MSRERYRFLLNLGRFLNSGTSLKIALDSLLKTCSNKAFREIINGIHSQVLEGSFFSEACNHYPQVFDHLACGVIRGGEQTGNLGNSLLWVAQAQKRYEDLRKQALLTLLYPCVVMCMAVIVGIFYVFFILPKFEDIFKDLLMKDSLPAFSQLIFDYAPITALVIPLLILVAALLFFIVKLKSKGKDASIRLESFLFRFPYVGHLKWYNLMGRFFSMFGMLGKSGYSALRAMEETCLVMARGKLTPVFQDLEEQMKHGIYFSQALEDAYLVNDTDLQMIVDGERGGQVYESCLELSEVFFDREQEMLKRIGKLLEPLLIILLSLYIGVLVMALILPLSQLLQQMV